MCGRYASSRKPEDLVEEFEIDRAPGRRDRGGAARARLQRRADQAGVRGRLRPAPRTDPAACAVLRWGLVPFWAKDPQIGNRMINARMETVAEKPAFRQAFAKRRCLLPADGYFEWYATDQPGQGRQAAQAAVLHPPRDGACWRWPGSTRSGATRAAPRTTRRASCGPAPCSRPSAEDALGHIHDRMPMLVEPRPLGGWLDPDRRRRRRPRASCWSPRRPGRLEAYPVSTAVNNVRNNGPELLEPLPLDDVPERGAPVTSVPRGARRRTATARLHTDRSRHPVATLVLGHGAGGGVDATRPGGAGQRAAAQRHHRGAGRAAVAGRRQEGRPGPSVLDECFVAAVDQLRAAHPDGGRRSQRRRPERRPHRRHLGASGVLALAFPLHPPGRPEKSRADELLGVRLPTLVVQGERDPFGGPRSSRRPPSS